MKRNRVWDAPRCQVLVEYAKWTARAAVNSGGPIKDTNTIYRLLDGVAFADVLSGETEISADEFNRWHRRETKGLCCRANDLRPQVAPFPVGWSAKLINVFLKTTVYVGNLGRAGLRNVLHPPLDNGLQAGLLERFPELDSVNFGRIRDITDYEKYRTVIEGCCAAAKKLSCSLIEVEQLAGLGLRDGEALPGELVIKVCHNV